MLASGTFQGQLQKDNNAYNLGLWGDYMLTDQWAVGLGVGIGKDYYAPSAGGSWMVAPNASYFWKINDKFFVQNRLYFEIGDAAKDLSFYAIGFNPTINCKVTENMFIGFSFGTINYTKLKDIDGAFNFDINSAAGLSVSYKF